MSFPHCAVPILAIIIIIIEIKECLKVEQDSL